MITFRGAKWTHWRSLKCPPGRYYSISRCSAAGASKATAPSDPPDSLSHGEGQLEVLPPLCGAQRVVVKGAREEGVHQGAEGHPIAPAGGEVLQVHVLRPRHGDEVERGYGAGLSSPTRPDSEALPATRQPSAQLSNKCPCLLDSQLGTHRKGVVSPAPTPPSQPGVPGTTAGGDAHSSLWSGSQWPSRAHLVAERFAAAPLEQDLLDAAGAGHAEALRALQLRPGLALPPADRGQAGWVGGCPSVAISSETMLHLLTQVARTLPTPYPCPGRSHGSQSTAGLDGV